MDAASRKRIIDNWNVVCDEVERATIQANRQIGDVQIVGVTKYVDLQATMALVDAGCQRLGENRPQALWGKAESGKLPDSIQWHVIGHLQRNKVRRTLKHRPLIHSVDSSRLLKSIAQESVAQSTTTNILLEINISEDENKTGMNEQQVRAILDAGLPDGVVVQGLMAMAGWGTSVGTAQSQFAAVRAFRDELRERTGLPLKELSMGMSGDFAAGIAEGATLVRIGSRLFEGIEL